MKSLLSTFILMSLLVSPAFSDDASPTTRNPDAAAEGPAAATAPAGDAAAKSADEAAPKKTTIEALDKTTKTFTGPAAGLRREVLELFDASRKVNGPEKAAARARLDKALDWERIAKDCLGGTHWKKQPEKNRAEFERLLHEVMVLTAYSRMDKFWNNATFKFDNIEVNGNEAKVKATFNVSGEKVPLEYYFDKKSGTWKIHDISYEEQRYSVNINEQIKSFLKEKPFAQLITSLKKRRDELLSQKETASSKASNEG